jgi:hypothetical protein
MKMLERSSQRSLPRPGAAPRPGAIAWLWAVATIALCLTLATASAALPDASPDGEFTPNQPHVAEVLGMPVMDVDAGLRGGPTAVCNEALNPANCQAWDKSSFLGLPSTGHNVNQFAVADNFVPAVSGNITDVCWWAFFGSGSEAAPEPGVFSIRLFADAGGVPEPAPLDSFTTGVDATLMRGPHVFPTFFVYHADLSRPVAVDAGSCYWIEITSPSLGASGGAFRWLTTNAGAGDDVVLQSRGSAHYTLSDIRFGRMAWCFNLAQAPVVCQTVFPPDNDQCATAEPLEAGQVIAGANYLGDVDAVRPCGLKIVDGPGVWYRVEAIPGIRYTASTCGLADFDTAVHVYCGTCGDLRPVACDDAACGDGTAEASWIPDSAETYYVLVYGENGSQGSFDLVLTTEPSINDPVVCEACPVSATSAQIIEDEYATCGTSTNSSCATASAATLGATHGGSIYASNAIHDVDVWRFTLPAPATVNIRIHAQFPPRYRLTSGPCDSMAQQVLSTGETCSDEVMISLPLSAGQHQLWVTVVEFDYLPCGSYNDYVLQITDVTSEIPVNDVCPSATELVPGNSVAGTNRFANPDPKPPCASNAIEGASVWYRVAGQPGMRYTASTCGAGTFDTILNVYCGADCESLIALACNDDGANCPNQRSEATWVSGGAQDFWILVHGSEGQEGEFELLLTSEPTAEPATPCTVCDVDPFAADVQEADLFICGPDSNRTCADAEPLIPGLVHGGTIDASMGSRDEDVWRFTLAAESSIVINLDAEFPPYYELYAGACDGPPVLVSSGGGVVCDPAPIADLLLPANEYSLVVTTPAFEGLACGTFNSYLLRVAASVTPVGACCREHGRCAIETEAACVRFVCDVAALLPPSFEGCYGDADGNSVVNSGDRGFISANQGQTHPQLLCQFDMDGNGVINAGDRGFISAAAGLCEPLPDWMNGSGLNHGVPDPRFSATYGGDGTTCETVACP